MDRLDELDDGQRPRHDVVDEHRFQSHTSQLLPMPQNDGNPLRHMDLRRSSPDGTTSGGATGRYNCESGQIPWRIQHSAEQRNSNSAPSGRRLFSTFQPTHDHGKRPHVTISGLVPPAQCPAPSSVHRGDGMAGETDPNESRGMHSGRRHSMAHRRYEMQDLDLDDRVRAEVSSNSDDDNRNRDRQATRGPTTRHSGKGFGRLLQAVQQADPRRRILGLGTPVSFVPASGNSDPLPPTDPSQGAQGLSTPRRDEHQDDPPRRETCCITHRPPPCPTPIRDSCCTTHRPTHRPPPSPTPSRDPCCTTHRPCWPPSPPSDYDDPFDFGPANI